MQEKTDQSSTPKARTTFKYLLGSILLVGFVVALSGCADSPTFAEAALREPVGFWHGLWHGLISPISFIISLLDSEVSMYAIYNNGGWYDFGFVLGAGILFGGSQHS